MAGYEEEKSKLRRRGTNTLIDIQKFGSSRAMKYR